MCVLIHSACSIEMKKKPVKDFFFHFLRKGRDSNPRYAKRTTVFETAPIDHSGTFPVLPSGCYLPKAGAKLWQNFHPTKYFYRFFSPSMVFSGSSAPNT